MSIDSQALYNQTNLLSWKTSYPICFVKDAPEPPIQTSSYISKFFPSDKILKQYIHNKSNKYVWQMSVSPDGNYIIILKNNNLELRSSKFDFNQIIFQCQIYKDLYPQWRTICWSNCSSYFGLSFSNGMCNIWDMQGLKLSLNTNCVKSNDFDVIIKVIIFEVSKGKVKLFLFTLNGKVFLYNINNFKVSNNIKSTIKFISTPILCCESSSNTNIMVFGTYNQVNSASGNEAFKSGIVLCRFIDEDPFIVPNVNGEHSCTAKYSWFSLFSNKRPSDATFMIRISKDDSKFAALHTSGKMSVWNFPSLIPCFVWFSSSTMTNPCLTTDSVSCNLFPNNFSDYSIAHICWWNSAYVTVALRNGRVLILGMDKLVQSKNDLITLHPLSQVEESIEKTFFALNCLSKLPKNNREDRASVQTVVKQSSWNIIGTLLNYFLADIQSVTLSSNSNLCAQSYTMIGFKLTTPDELFTIRINKKQYSEALLLATQYGLDSDLVFKKQWRDSQKTIDDIKHILIKIKKRNWILNECLEQIPDNVESMKFLLKLGFYLTDIDQWENGDGKLNEEAIETMRNDFRNSNVDADITEKLFADDFSLVQVEMIRIRMKLLNYCDKLIVYERIIDISNDIFKDDLFKELKNLSSFEIAVKFARNNNINGLRVLLEFYNNILSKHILTILSNIPESIKPSTYRDLIVENLPPLSNKKDLLFTKELDWCEAEKFAHIYNTESTQNEAENNYYQNNPDQLSFVLNATGDCQPIVKEWCQMRIRKIEEETFNVSHSLEILQIFKELYEEIDTNLEFNLRFLYEGVYNCHIGNSFISLCEFEQLSDLEKANLLMSKTNLERFLINFNHWIIPMLEEINNQSTERSLTFFREYLVNLGKKNLIGARKLLEDNETTGKLMEIVQFRDIVNSYITILCNDDEVSNISECALISKLLSALVPKEYISELKQLQEIDRYIIVLRILEKYELKKTIKFVHENKMNGELVENLITNMIFHYLKSVKNINKAIMKSVFTEIQVALSLVFKSVHPTLIFKNLLKSMLESGDKKKINLASEFMILSTNLTPIDNIEYEEKLVDFSDAVQCILVAVRNYINMSTSSKDSNILLAKYCLALIVNPTEDTIVENEIIKCSEFLDKWNCSLVPIEFRSVENRFELLKNCLEKNKNLYREMEEVIEAGAYFYENKKSDRKFREGEALRLIAQRAFSCNDRTNLEIAMSSLIHRNHKPCWNECLMALKLLDYPADKRCILGRYAVTYCPNSSLPETVRFVNDVELASLTLTETSPSKDGNQLSTNTNTNSNLITQPIKYLSLGLTDLSSKINLKSLIDRSSETLSKLTTQVTQIGSRAPQEVLYKNNDAHLLKGMNLDLIYQRNGRFSLKCEDDNSVTEIVKMLTLPLLISDEQSHSNTDQMHLKMIQFNLNRDTYLAMVHAMFIEDLGIVYHLRNDLTANTYSRALVYCMVALNLILKYSRPFPAINTISTDAFQAMLQPLKKEMSESELSIINSAYQEFSDYLLLDSVIANIPSVCPLKFFSSVDYRQSTISQLSEFSDNVQLLPFALLLADRYNVDRYNVLWNYFVTFVERSSVNSSEFEDNFPCFTEVFNVDRFIETSASALSIDVEKLLSSDSVDRIAEFRTILKVLPETCPGVLLFGKSPDQHREWIGVFDSIFNVTDKCDYLDLCLGNTVTIISCLKKVVNSENVDVCSQLLASFNLSEEFARIKNDFSFVLANQILWSKTNGTENFSDFLPRFNKSLRNFSVTDYDNCKDFVSSTLFERTENYLSPELKIGLLKTAGKFIDSIGDNSDTVSDKWSSVALEVTIWLDHFENTVVKVAEKLHQLPSVSKKIIVSAEYMPPDNYWQCLLTEMLMEAVTYQDLFTLTWDLSIDSFIVDDSIYSQICHLCSSKFLPIDAIVEKLSQIFDELDDYMDSENVEGILARVLDHVKGTKERVHRMLLDEFVFRIRKNKSSSTLAISQHILIILKNWGLPVNEKITFQKNNLHLIDAFMQDCDSPQKMKLIPKVIELIELVEEDNNLWQCWIKSCVINGPEYCSFVFEEFEHLKTNKLYDGRVHRLAKDAVQSLTAFNSADAISILILMDPIAAVDQVNAILVSLKSDPTEFTNTMKNINVKALKIIVDGKLIPIYAKTVLYQRLVNFLTKEMNDASLVEEVLEQLKVNGLMDEATWLTSSSSHINPAMKTIEMVSGFWKRFSNN